MRQQGRLKRQRGIRQVIPIDAVNAVAVLPDPQGHPVVSDAETNINYHTKLATVGRRHDCTD